jgi:hypothetical protein
MAAITALLGLSADTEHRAPWLGGVLRALSRKTLQTLFDPYRPERHYMRGPGPRWHAKHGRALPTTGRDG